MIIQSPLTHSHHTHVELEIPSKMIIERYKELGIDTSKYFEGLDKIQLVTCDETGYRFYFPFSIFGDDQFYTDLQTHIPGYYVNKRWEHLQAVPFVKNGKLLEIGTGSGHFLQLLNKSQFETYGLELNTTAVQDAQAKGLNVVQELIQDHAKNNANKYDTVCCFQVLEHIADVHSFLSAALETLKKGGRLIIAVPNNNPYIFKHDVYHTLNLPPHHAGLWNRNAFENLQKVFPVQLKNVIIEPLTEIKEWFNVQKNHLGKKNFIFKLLHLIPRPVYKLLIGSVKNKIEGRNILVVFEKL